MKEQDHFKQRLSERYGLTISEYGMKEIKNRIAAEDTIPYEDLSGSRITHIVDYGGKWIRVVKQRSRGRGLNRLVTALPMRKRDLYWLRGYLKGVKARTNKLLCNYCLRFFDTKKGRRIHSVKMHKGNDN